MSRHTKKAERDALAKARRKTRRKLRAKQKARYTDRKGLGIRRKTHPHRAASAKR